MDMLRTPDEVIYVLGGTTKTGIVTNASPQSVSNWRRAKRIPPQYFVAVSKALEGTGNTVSPEVFGMKTITDGADAS